MSYAGQYQMPQYGQQQQQGGYPPQQGGYPPRQQGGYPPPQQGGYPPPQQGGYPPPQQAGYPPPQQGGYPPPQQQGPFQVPQPQGNPMMAMLGQNQMLKNWFDAVDADRSGRISYIELQQALSSGGFTFSASTAERLVRMFDKAGDGEINFDEFQSLHAFITAMTNGFKSRDKSGDGILDGTEIRAALGQSGYNLTEPTFQLMMRKFDRDRRGGLKLDDYIELSIMIGTARNVFGFYDRQRTGFVTFSFDSFFTAALSLR